MNCRNIFHCLLCVFIWLAGLIPVKAMGDTPDWLDVPQNQAIPNYAPETDAVVLHNECRTVVTRHGEIKSFFRIAYKILSSDGKNLAWIQLPFDSETKISKLKAWNIKPEGIIHEVGKKEAFETQILDTGSTLFSDSKKLILLIPQVEIDSVIAYEYERSHRPYVLQDIWQFEQHYPVLKSRFELELPSNWSFRYVMLNHPELEPKNLENNRWVWEMQNLPGIAEEEAMPPVSTLASTLAVTFYPDDEEDRGQVFHSWKDLGSWMNKLMKPRLSPSIQIIKAARQLSTPRAMAEFVQRQIRYVAIEIGIGGYQPHYAGEIFDKRYGDCKDKVTLLKSLCQAIKLDIYPVLIHSNRRKFVSAFPSLIYFNHMIAAIPFDEDNSGSVAVFTHPELGQLLLFDPTDPDTPFGHLPVSLQGTKALLISDSSAYEIETPLAAPSYNRLLRTGEFELSENGSLKGKMIELYRGSLARQERYFMRRTIHNKWLQSAQEFLAWWLPGVRLDKLSVGDLDNQDAVSETYSFEAPFFGQSTGDLLLVRPCVLGSKEHRIKAVEKRTHPFQFKQLRLDSDMFQITLPTGYVVEELPETVEVNHPFAHYRSIVTEEENKLTYARYLEIKQLSVPADQVPALDEFYQLIKRDEQAIVVLKRISDKEDHALVP